MKPAVFLDRDGTIIKDKGVIKHTKDVVFYDYTFESLLKLQKHYLLFAITNQPWVAKGILTLKEVEGVNNYISERLRERGIIIQEFYYCPHLKEDNCICRKPKTFFIEQALKKYPLDIRNSFVIGDHASDVQLAVNAGAKGIYVLTGHGRRHVREIPGEIRNKVKICQNLRYAVRFILNKQP